MVLQIKSSARPMEFLLHAYLPESLQKFYRIPVQSLRVSILWEVDR